MAITKATGAVLGNYPRGSNNVVVGNGALDSLDASSPGGSNVAIGSNAMTANTTGTENVAIGAAAGDALTTGGENVAIGS